MSQIQEQIVLVRSSATLVQASGDSTGGRAQIEQIVDVLVPQILEQSVEAIKARMRLFTFERRVVVQQLLTGVFGGLGRVVVRLQKHRRQHGWTCPQPSPSLWVDDRGAGKRSVLVSVVESTVECKYFQFERNGSSLVVRVGG